MNLFGKDQRPKWNDIMLNELAEQVGKEINKWCNNETDLEQCIEDAKSILDHNLNDNGFELAKDFEDKYYSPDLELVEILDCVSSDVRSILDKHVKKWVLSDNITLDMPIGTIVHFKLSGKVVEGEITKHYADEAKYGIFIEGEGNVKGESHYLIKFEDLITEPQVK